MKVDVAEVVQQGHNTGASLLRERRGLKGDEASEGRKPNLTTELVAAQASLLPRSPLLLVSFVLFLLQGILFLTESLSHSIAASYHSRVLPEYLDHDHHLCHVFVLLHFLTVGWYFGQLLFLFATGFQLHSANGEKLFRQAWLLRLTGLPNVFLIVSEALCFVAMLFTFGHHSEKMFVSIVSFGCGLLLSSLCIFCLVLVYIPLREGKRYAWQWLAFAGMWLTALVVAFLYHQLEGAALRGTLALLLLYVGLWQTRRQLAALHM